MAHVFGDRIRTNDLAFRLGEAFRLELLTEREWLSPTGVVVREMKTGRQQYRHLVEHNELFASIRNSRPINNGEFMAKSTMMGIMGREACYTGQRITWQDAFNSQVTLGPERYAFGDLPTPAVARPGTPPQRQNGST